MKKQFPLLTLALLLAACGGGGGDNAATDQPTPRPDGGARDPLFPITLDDDELPGHRQVDILVDGKKYAHGNVVERRAVVDPNVLPRGLSATQTLHVNARKADGTVHSETVASRSYRGFYSGAVIGDKLRTFSDPEEEASYFDLNYFTPTPTAGLPNAGRTTYHGQAFGFQSDNNATFHYHVNFADKTGYGEVAANRYHPAIYLSRETLRQERDADRTYYEFDGSTDSRRGPYGAYDLILSGPQAEEVIGSVDFYHNGENTTLGVYGTRGDITP